MKKHYTGYALPSDRRVSYELEYLCPQCGSEAVAIDASQPVPHFCDGGPSTGDELRTWHCKACGHRAQGLDFVLHWSPIGDER